MCEQCTWSMNGINPIRAVKGDNLEDFLPLLEVKSPNTNGVVAAIFKKGNHEEMHFFFNTLLLEVENDFGTLNFVQRYEYTKLNLALGNLWFEWVTKGIYLGKRRIFLCIHIDDFFAATQIYRSTDFRIGEDAVHAAVEWIQATNQRLPSGSNVRFELAYNGAGYEALNFEPSFYYYYY
ncbi:uncharacterized protein LOC135120766 [Zophobas morio]|uniref:uncharacterized protein LOC135120766 n=1 Tax=Zophobas morio TaxID=2755281 RepID=UPI003082F1BA